MQFLSKLKYIKNGQRITLKTKANFINNVLVQNGFILHNICFYTVWGYIMAFMFLLCRAPSPSKRKERSEDRSKDRTKEKAPGKETAEKDRGRDKTRKRRSASTGSSSSRYVAWQTVTNYTPITKLLSTLAAVAHWTLVGMKLKLLAFEVAGFKTSCVLPVLF